MARRKKAVKKMTEKEPEKQIDDELKEIEKYDTDPAPAAEASPIIDVPPSPPLSTVDSGILTTENEIRTLAIGICEALLPSAVGDPRFEWMTQGRSLACKKSRTFFSTCGELAMAVLFCLGYRGPVLNRNLRPDVDGAKRQYQFGQNMAWIYGAEKWRKSAKEGIWVKCRPFHNAPGLGDILFVSNGPPRTEHVSIFAGTKEEGVDPKESGSVWKVWQAGQGGTLDQHGGPGEPTFSIIGRGRVIGKLNDRQLHGWIDVGKLVGKLTKPAILPDV